MPGPYPYSAIPADPPLGVQLVTVVQSTLWYEEAKRAYTLGFDGTHFTYTTVDYSAGFQFPVSLGTTTGTSTVVGYTNPTCVDKNGLLWGPAAIFTDATHYLAAVEAVNPLTGGVVFATAITDIVTDITVGLSVQVQAVESAIINGVNYITAIVYINEPTPTVNDRWSIAIVNAVTGVWTGSGALPQFDIPSSRTPLPVGAVFQEHSEFIHDNNGNCYILSYPVTITSEDTDGNLIGPSGGWTLYKYGITPGGIAFLAGFSFATPVGYTGLYNPLRNTVLVFDTSGCIQEIVCANGTILQTSPSIIIGYPAMFQLANVFYGFQDNIYLSRSQRFQADVLNGFFYAAGPTTEIAASTIGGVSPTSIVIFENLVAIKLSDLSVIGNFFPQNDWISGDQTRSHWSMSGLAHAPGINALVAKDTFSSTLFALSWPFKVTNFASRSQPRISISQ